MGISSKGKQKMSYPISDNRFTKEKMDNSKMMGKGKPPKVAKPKGRVKDGGAMI